MFCEGALRASDLLGEHAPPSVQGMGDSRTWDALGWVRRSSSPSICVIRFSQERHKGYDFKKHYLGLDFIYGSGKEHQSHGKNQLLPRGQGAEGGCEAGLGGRRAAQYLVIAT